MDDLIFKSFKNTLEIKEITDEFVHIEGFAATFGNIDREGDIIAKGAFTNTLTKRKPKLLNQHRMDQLVGVIDMIAEVEEGLFIKGRMPKANSMVMDMLPLLKMGALGDFSIGFNVVDSDTAHDGTRTLKELDLWEVSLVTIPANEKAKVTSVKKMDIKDSDEKIIDAEAAESINTRTEFEQMLKKTGSFTRKSRVILASYLKKDFSQGNLVGKKNRQSDSVNEEKLLMEAMDRLRESFI